MKAEYKNIDEQIEIIKEKNILIKDEQKAKKILINENYYNLITGYKDVFIDIKTSRKAGIEIFDNETYFEEIYAVYRFDRDLRNIMFKYISIIETHMKSYISDVFSKKYGTEDYLKKENFYISDINEPRFNQMVEAIKSNLIRNINNYPDIRKYYRENRDVPFWMLDTLITFGTIVKFYILMKKDDKIEIANILGMQYTEVQDYLKMLNIVRNISAHNNILFDAKFDILYNTKTNNKYHDILEIKQKERYTSGINDIMAVIIILRRFLDDKEYSHLATELIEIIDEIKEELDKDSFETLLEKMGLPLAYTKITII